MGASARAGFEPAKDWLNYGQFARPIWQRVKHELESQDGQRPAGSARLPTGDPLVVGVYGEWGAGKTKLLELVHELAALDDDRELAQRALDPQAYDKELCLTVPVWFHPWKYEHEASLVVPLLMHISQALAEHLSASRSRSERLRHALSALAKDGKEVGEKISQAKGAVEGALSNAEKALGWVHGTVSNKWVRTVASVAAGTVGLGGAVEAGLKRVEEATGALLRGVDGDESDESDESDEGDNENEGDTSAGSGSKRKATSSAASQPAKRGAKASATFAVPVPTADGSHYYALHQHLRALTRITPERAAKIGQPVLRHGVRINFAVFIDDLDRCLPEKAVQVLEIIKTVFNTESFAFVVALDDEVIERGIAHRYRDYRFEGAKPEMPITGFEYLEKIVHLPFKLPQLTRAQGRAFIMHLEDHLRHMPGGKDLPRLWFAPAQSRDGDAALRRAGLGSSLDEGAKGSMLDLDLAAGDGASPAPAAGTPRAAAPAAPEPPLHPTVLVDLLLNAFAAPVPRKLARAVEFLHQWQRVMLERGIALHVPPRGSVASSGASAGAGDARIFLALGMLQLFAPELYRMLRRKPLIWHQWLSAYVGTGSQATQTTQRNADFAYIATGESLQLDVSDDLLFEWVMQGD